MGLVPQPPLQIDSLAREGFVMQSLAQCAHRVGEEGPPHNVVVLPPEVGEVGGRIRVKVGQVLCQLLRAAKVIHIYE